MNAIQMISKHFLEFILVSKGQWSSTVKTAAHISACASPPRRSSKCCPVSISDPGAGRPICPTKCHAAFIYP